MSETWRRGRRPKSRQIKLVEGAELRRRHKTEPVYLEVAPEPPIRIKGDPVALEEYQRIVAELMAAKVLNASHGEAVAILATSIADLTRVAQDRARIRAVPLKDRTPEFYRVALALDRRFDKLQLQTMRFLGEFGWSPMSSARVRQLEPDGPGVPAVGLNPFGAWLAGRAKLRG